jgi:hypothetical protein
MAISKKTAVEYPMPLDRNASDLFFMGTTPLVVFYRKLYQYGPPFAMKKNKVQLDY